MNKSFWCASAFAAWALANHAYAAPIQVCVRVEPKEWTEAQAKPSHVASVKEPNAQAQDLSTEVDQNVTTPVAVALDPERPPGLAAPRTERPKIAATLPTSTPSFSPLGIDPEVYLQRLLAYQVTHHPRYEAVERGCKEHLTVELYALDEGWTVFARFSEHAREEKVDQVMIDEFGALADRLASALLDDLSVNETLNRENVLRADSEESMRRVKSQSHFALAMGTALRIGKLPTAKGPNDTIEQDTRLISPLAITLGSRNKFRAFALDPFARLELGTQEFVPRSNDAKGGHVDYSGSGALGLHFLRYFSPRGIGSPYFGGGAKFELARYTVTEAGSNGRDGAHDRFFSGGLNADLLTGYEFMRASSLHFFVQLEASLPAYAVDARTKSGGVDSAYVPTITALAGLLL